LRLPGGVTRGVNGIGRCRRTRRRSHRRVRSVGGTGRAASCVTTQGPVDPLWRPCRRTRTASRIRAYRTSGRVCDIHHTVALSGVQQDALQNSSRSRGEHRRSRGVDHDPGRSSRQPADTRLGSRFHTLRLRHDPVSRMSNTLSQPACSFRGDR